MQFDAPFHLNLNTFQRRFGLIAVAAAVLIFILLVLNYVVVIGPLKSQDRLLIAPMIGQLEGCSNGKPVQSQLANDPAYIRCLSETGSAASLIEPTLAAMGTKFSRDGRYEMGYTLNVPLLSFLEEKILPGGRDWTVNDHALTRLVRTIAQTDRQLVLYLFSNHFSAFAPIESVLAADTENIGITVDGPLSSDKHYGMNVYPWSVVNTENSLTSRRLQVLKALIGKLCDQPFDVIDRIQAITLLGETHHLFPGFESGMGFSGAYRVTDYSNTSVSGFREYLQSKFASVKELNDEIGGSYRNFDEVNPPTVDETGETLTRSFSHLDAYATGLLPVQGWLIPDRRLSGSVEILLNREHVGFAKTSLARRELLDRIPGLQSPDIAWRYDLDFRKLPAGLYEVAAVVETRNGTKVLLGQSKFSVGSIGIRSSVGSIPASLSDKSELSKLRTSLDLGFAGSFEMPTDGAKVFFNPLAVEWQRFRSQQVLEYIRYFEKYLRNSCLNNKPIFSHQLFPYPNPSWAFDKYGVEASLREGGSLHLGISLYGEASYGDTFFDWKLQNYRGVYGVTEFHPLRSMNSIEFEKIIAKHSSNGARFISFFTEARGDRPSGVFNRGSTIPYFSPGNPEYGSDRLYESVQGMMK